jgi:hypothetical protein
MRLTLEPTEEFFMAGEVMVRAWKGTDDKGKPVVAFIAAVSMTSDVGAVGLVSIPPPDKVAALAWANEVLQRRGT